MRKILKKVIISKIIVTVQNLSKIVKGKNKKKIKLLFFLITNMVANKSCVKVLYFDRTQSELFALIPKHAYI